MDATDYKRDLLERIENQATFRGKIRAQHPDVFRNDQSALALRALYQRLQAFPGNAPKLVRLAELWSAALESGHFDDCANSEAELIGLYGFEEDAEVDGDPEDFLAALLSELETDWERDRATRRHA
jgi:hypothetical protein